MGPGRPVSFDPCPQSLQIALGTPGRVFDMISRKVLRPYDIKMFVLDEADEMLSRGFKDQIYDVFRHLNSSIQVRPN